MFRHKAVDGYGYVVSRPAINEARILRVLLENGPLSRAEIARRLDLTKSGMTNVIAGLLVDKLIVEADGAVARGRVGRPGTDVDLNPDGAYSLGAEVIVGSISLLALDLRGRIVGGQAVTRPVDTTSAEITLGHLKRLVGDFMKENLPEDASISGLCLAIPGFVTRDGHVAHAQKLGWRDVPMQRLLSEHMAWSVAVENDANVSAFAEWYMTAPVDRHDLLLISLSTGAGAGLISQGRNRSRIQWYGRRNWADCPGRSGIRRLRPPSDDLAGGDWKRCHCRGVLPSMRTSG